jgi:hypothetical protein
MNIILRRQPSIRDKRMQGQWRCVRGGSHRGRSGGKSNSDFQKMAAFHDISQSCNGQ